MRPCRGCKRGGRLIYVGAGTSGRIAVQDGAELPPTFNWPAEQVVFVIAGGERALLRAVENAEDSGADGAAAMIGNERGRGRCRARRGGERQYAVHGLRAEGGARAWGADDRHRQQ